MLDRADPEISLALPCFNERENIASVVEHSIRALERLKRSWELIVIDNHSNDGTPEQVLPFAERDARVRLIVHDANRFYSGSCRTALTESRGRYVAIMDSDGQFSADDLPKFIKAIDGGANLVLGWRKIRHDPLARKIMSRFFNWMARQYIGFDLHDLNAGIRMFDRQFIDAAEIKHTLNMANPELYMRAKAARLVVTEVEASHRAREKGQSCHNVIKLVQIFMKVRKYFRGLKAELVLANATLEGERERPTRAAGPVTSRAV